ncbi:MAG: hypothetical protein V1936_00700 [Patescibacteria group bacterium]
MTEKTKLSLLICHCNFPESLQEITRELLQAALPDYDLKLKVICPTDHRDKCVPGDPSWPRIQTVNWLAELLPQTDIFLASDWVLMAARNLDTQRPKRDTLGRNWASIIALFSEKINTALQQLQINFDRELLEANLKIVLRDLSLMTRIQIDQTFPQKGTQWAMLIDELHSAEKYAGLV